MTAKDYAEHLLQTFGTAELALLCLEEIRQQFAAFNVWGVDNTYFEEVKKEIELL